MKSLLLLLERALLAIGVVCLGWYGLAALDAAYTQREARQEMERILAQPAPVPATGMPAAADEGMGSNLVGLLEIPRLRLSTPVVEGDDNRALRGTAGHLSDTPRPWEKGNSAIAAHRDGLFRPLRYIRIGDDVRLQTPHGELLYRVKDTRIVRPTDLSVLDQKGDQTLTLITCYPFYYVGSAPKRFVVHAERVIGSDVRVARDARGGRDFSIAERPAATAGNVVASNARERANVGPANGHLVRKHRNTSAAKRRPPSANMIAASTEMGPTVTELKKGGGSGTSSSKRGWFRRIFRIGDRETTKVAKDAKRTASH